MEFKVLYQKSFDSYLDLDTFSLYSLKESPLDFPAGPVAKSPPANAGDMDLIPGPGRFHMPQGHQAQGPQLLKPEHLEPMLCTKRSHSNEKPARHNREKPLLNATRGSLSAATKTQIQKKTRVPIFQACFLPLVFSACILFLTPHLFTTCAGNTLPSHLPSGVSFII